MRHSLSILITGLALLSINFAAVFAQNTTPEAGDPPILALISISAPDEAGIVTISGAAGAVFPAAQIIIRNLYTEQSTIVNAGITGSFTAQLYGPSATPFWISPSAQVPESLRGVPGSLPGGPGVIVTSSAQPTAAADTAPTTQLIVDGSLDDWAVYPDAALTNSAYALINQDSLYIANIDNAPIGAVVAVDFTLDRTTYEVIFDPRQPQTALASRLDPNPGELGAVSVSTAINEAGDTVEARIALTPLFADFTDFVLAQVYVRTDGGEELESNIVTAVPPRVDEQDGIVYASGRFVGDATTFTVAGVLAQGAATWTATGRVSAINFAPGENATLEMDISLNVPEVAELLSGLRLFGELSLQPIAISTDGSTTAAQPIAALNSNNGWSNLRTASGLARDNLRADITLGTATVEPGQIIRREGTLLAGMRFALTLPADLPAGLYVPVFKGRAQIGDGEVTDWTANGIFGQGAGISRVPLTRLPLVFNVGGIEQTRLTWTLLYDNPSDGSRGILADEVAGIVALSNRVRFNSPTTILPPGIYPLEPYLLNFMPNAYDTTSAPLVPLLFPGGRLEGSITSPNGFNIELPNAAIVQNILSTPAIDERVIFGGQSPLDAYRLTTLNPAYAAYPFDDYGNYTMTLSGQVEDIYGNLYTGGGTYHVLIAEPLDLSPGVLPGTPFEVGDTFFAGARIAPGLPADITVTAHIYPLDGSPTIERVITGQANRYGIFTPADEALTFETAGEYVIDYEARFTGEDGRLWAASLRSAGVIASADRPIIAHGQRGLSGYSGEQQAWFDTAVYPPDVDLPAELYTPYFTGDIAFILDNGASGLHPALQVQDTLGAYAAWLAGSLPVGRETVEQLTNRGELPLIPVLGGPPGIYSPALLPDFIANDAYAYFTATRPDITVRQMVIGQADGSLALNWDSDDPYNGQIGAGINGDRPGDFAFLFGGTIIRNAEAGVEDAAIYAALSVVGNEDGSARVMPPYRGAAGGPDSGPLLTVRGEAVELFFQPTGVQPGQVLTEGDTLAIAGQVAPTLESNVAITVISPGGTIANFAGLTNSIGYYYNPANDFAVNEIGVWTVEIAVSPAEVSSAGVPQPPLPVGGVLGTLNRRFEVFIVAADSPSLTWQEGGDTDRPISPTNPFNFTVSVPQGWTDATAYLTVSTASTVVQSGEFPITGASTTYTLNRSLLSRDFPNIEGDGLGSGAAASDVLKITFAIIGTDESGTFATQTRTFYVFHDRLISFDAVLGGEG